jgi:ubiquinone/menaquinone biosynthesis C-methylase UbiE
VTKRAVACLLPETVDEASTRPASLQAEYYTSTARRYDELHTADAADEHFTALELIEMLSSLHGLRSFLDVGAGTGRATGFLLKKGRRVHGIEPVRALIDVAEQSGIPKHVITEGSGDRLPFHDESFDAVVECGVLHHVKDPSRVVSEMMRVARKAIFLSDANRFGQGNIPSRLVKLLLCKSGLWNAAQFVRTKGRMYTLTEGDGLAYSYSVFDSYEQLAQWADRILLFSTAPDSPTGSWFHPLLTAPHVLLCALKR